MADNTTVNLYKLACAALDARPGRRVIVTDQDNFPSDRYVLAGIAAQRGAELRMLSTDIDQGLDPGAVRAAVDEDTALVSLSHVAYRSGALADMAAVTEIVHQAGALMLWDLCHSVGAVPVELDRCDVDLAVGCTYKYLNAGPGAPAFLYVSARLREVLRQPNTWGWFSQRDQFAMGPNYDPAAGVAKFMTGTPSIPGTAAVEEGARLLLEAGLDPMRVKSQRLTSYLIELGDAWLEPLGCALATPRDGSRRGGHVTYRHPQAERLVERLAGANIITDYRTPDRLRLGRPRYHPLHRRVDGRHRHPRHHRDRMRTEPWLNPSPTPDTCASTGVAVRAAAAVERARRDAVHRHPPDLRAVVQAAAARVRQGAGRTRGRQHHARHAHAAPDAGHPEDRGGPARRARDHDADPVHPVPRVARHLERVRVAQFRELEAVLGRRDRMMVAQYDEGSAEWERITAAMSRPSLFDSFVRYLAGQGYDVPADNLHRDVGQPKGASDAMQQVLKKVYDDDTDATAVCELLVDVDEGMQEWRYHHVKMVERTIGGPRGTGSAGATYLRTTLGQQPTHLPRPVGGQDHGLGVSAWAWGHGLGGGGGRRSGDKAVRGRGRARGRGGGRLAQARRRPSARPARHGSFPGAWRRRGRRRPAVRAGQACWRGRGSRRRRSRP